MRPLRAMGGFGDGRRDCRTVRFRARSGAGSGGGGRGDEAAEEEEEEAEAGDDGVQRSPRRLAEHVYVLRLAGRP